MKESYRRAVVFYSRLLLGIIFAMSSLGKVTDVRGFAVMVADYNLLPAFLVLPFSYILSWTEFTCAIFLLFGVQLRAAGAATAGMLLMFIFAVAFSMVKGLDIDCGCFDIPFLGSSKVGWHVIVRNIVLLLMASSLIFMNSKEVVLDENRS